MSSSKKDWKKYFKRKIRTHRSLFNFNAKALNDIVDFGERNYKYDGKRWKKHEENGDDNSESEMQIEVSDDFVTNNVDALASAKAVYDLNVKVDSAVANIDTSNISGEVSAVANSLVQRDGSGNITANQFNGRATSANWADLGERYEADAQYDRGTVLAIGGDKEVTEFKTGMSLAGVISTHPGFKLNDNAENQDWPFVCLKGRVPVKINGHANKGDYILADNDGKATSYKSIKTIDEQNRLIGISIETGYDLVEVKV